MSHSAEMSETQAHMRNVFLLASRPIRVLPGVVPKNISQGRKEAVQKKKELFFDLTFNFGPVTWVNHPFSYQGRALGKLQGLDKLHSVCFIRNTL